jgi:carbon-monoxide dehydrogenase small subunit
MKINLTINDENRSFEIDPSMTLLEVLRENGYMSVKQGCDTGTCGLCTVLMDDKPILSCSILAAKVDGHFVKTLEGIGEEAKNIGDLLAKEGADQCGFCSPGLIINVYAMKKTLSNPSEEDINKFLVGNLCRCTGYVGQTRAIKKYLGGE